MSEVVLVAERAEDGGDEGAFSVLSPTAALLPNVTTRTSLDSGGQYTNYPWKICD